MKTNLTKSILLLAAIIGLASHCLFAQSITVTGTVCDAADGNPIFGCSIQVKGTKIFTTTDVNGKYSIQAEKGKVLIFSYKELKK